MLVPMHPHQPVQQLAVLGAHPRHGRFQRVGVGLRLVFGDREHAKQRVAHVAGELAVDDGVQRVLVLASVLARHGTELSIRPAGKDLAHGQLIGAGAAFGRFVQRVDVLVEHRRIDGCRLGFAAGGQDHGKQPIRLEREILADVFVEVAMIPCVILVLQRVDFFVTATEKHVVEERLIGASTVERFVQDVRILSQGPAHDGFERFAKVAGRLFVDVVEEMAPVHTLEGGFDLGHVHGIGDVGDDADEL